MLGLFQLYSVFVHDFRISPLFYLVFFVLRLSILVFTISIVVYSIPSFHNIFAFFLSYFFVLHYRSPPEFLLRREMAYCRIGLINCRMNEKIERDYYEKE